MNVLFRILSIVNLSCSNCVFTTGPNGRPIDGPDGEPDEAPFEGPNEEHDGDHDEGHGGGPDGGPGGVLRVLRKVEAGDRGGSLFSSLVQQTQPQASLVSSGSYLERFPSSLACK